jgi:site-specific DNA-methyltransferase (adenine-specific)
MGKINYKFPYQLINEDCLKEMKNIPDKSIDMILADLPYGTTACKWDVMIPFKPLWAQYKRVIKKNGVIALFGAEPFSSLLRCSNIKEYKYDWIWKKERPSNPQLAKKTPLKSYEDILIFYTEPGKYSPQDLIEISEEKRKVHNPEKNQLGHCVRKPYIQTHTGYPDSIVFYKAERGLHPTQKPVALCEYLIKTYTQEGETVLDNVMGSGTTGVACINTNRKFIGIEKDKKYFKLAKQRLYAHYYRKIPRIHYYIINECMKNRISSLFKRTYLDELINKERR